MPGAAAASAPPARTASVPKARPSRRAELRAEKRRTAALEAEACELAARVAPPPRWRSGEDIQAFKRNLDRANTKDPREKVIEDVTGAEYDNALAHRYYQQARGL